MAWAKGFGAFRRNQTARYDIEWWRVATSGNVFVYALVSVEMVAIVGNGGNRWMVVIVGKKLGDSFPRFQQFNT
jgi:hypothetical protein